MVRAREVDWPDTGSRRLSAPAFCEFRKVLSVCMMLVLHLSNPVVRATTNLQNTESPKRPSDSRAPQLKLA